MATPDPPLLVLWTRPRCHLCDVAKAELRRLQERLTFRIEERDVDARDEWTRRFGDEVPVGTVEGRKVFKYRVDPERLAVALRRRGARPHGVDARSPS